MPASATAPVSRVVYEMMFYSVISSNTMHMLGKLPAL
jgi:hypothetical protein